MSGRFASTHTEEHSLAWGMLAIGPSPRLHRSTDDYWFVHFQTVLAYHAALTPVYFTDANLITFDWLDTHW